MSFSLKNNNIQMNDVINNRIKICFERFKNNNLPIFSSYEKIRNRILKFKIRKCCSCEKNYFNYYNT